MVSGGFACPTTTRTSIPDSEIDDANPVVIGDESAITNYHARSAGRRPDGPSPPPSPGQAPSGSSGMTWTALTYESRYTADATDDDEWKTGLRPRVAMVVDDLDMGTEYTFEVRALGSEPCRGW